MNFICIRIQKLSKRPTGDPRGELTKEVAKGTSYSVRVWRGRCDDSVAQHTRGCGAATSEVWAAQGGT